MPRSSNAKEVCAAGRKRAVLVGRREAQGHAASPPSKYGKTRKVRKVVKRRRRMQPQQPPKRCHVSEEEEEEDDDSDDDDESDDDEESVPDVKSPLEIEAQVPSDSESESESMSGSESDSSSHSQISAAKSTGDHKYNSKRDSKSDSRSLAASKIAGGSSQPSEGPVPMTSPALGDMLVKQLLGKQHHEEGGKPAPMPAPAPTPSQNPDQKPKPKPPTTAVALPESEILKLQAHFLASIRKLNFGPEDVLSLSNKALELVLAGKGQTTIEKELRVLAGNASSFSKYAVDLYQYVLRKHAESVGAVPATTGKRPLPPAQAAPQNQAITRSQAVRPVAAPLRPPAATTPAPRPRTPVAFTTGSNNSAGTTANTRPRATTAATAAVAAPVTAGAVRAPAARPPVVPVPKANPNVTTVAVRPGEASADTVEGLPLTKKRRLELLAVHTEEMKALLGKVSNKQLGEKERAQHKAAAEKLHQRILSLGDPSFARPPTPPYVRRPHLGTYVRKPWRPAWRPPVWQTYPRGPRAPGYRRW